MQTIQLQFPGGKELKYQAPASFEDLTQEQYIAAIKLMKKAGSNPHLQWGLIPLLIKMPIAHLEKLNEVQRVELLMSMSFLFDPDKLPSKCMIPKVQVTIRSYHGPGDVLKHLSFGEFMMAETKLDGFERTGSMETLDQFCGVLYRVHDKARSKESDKRTPFKEGQVEYCGKQIGKADQYLKTAILMNYHGAKAMLPKLYRNVFPPALQNQPTGTAKKSASLTWLNTLIQMSDRDVTKLHDIESTSMHTVLKVLDDTIAHNEQMKREMEKMRRP